MGDEDGSQTPQWDLLSTHRDPRRPECAFYYQHPHQQPRTLRLDGGDEYVGEVLLEGESLVPHGCGTLLSRNGGHCYVGDFTHRWRDGYGKLATDRYVLWGRWRANRPDLANSCRVDYPNGDRYVGFLTMAPLPAPDHTENGSACRLSRFSAWIQSTAPVRQRWGELVAADGDRYFGEWAGDRPHGFGCYAHRSSDRYVGRFRDGRFHGTGVLFSRALAQAGPSRILEGAFLSESTGATPAPVMHAAGTSHDSPCVLDGVWVDGRFAGEGHVTLPGGARVSAEWRSASQPSSGEAIFASTRPPQTESRWREHFQWEPLLCGMSEVRYQEAFAGCAPLRERLAHATAAASPADGLRALLLEFLSANAQVLAALRIFRRCFFFFYGTCGRSGEIGAGQGGNPLGWCSLRRPFGGCVHADRGRPVTPADLSAALCDIYSFTRSVLRWTADMLGEEGLAYMDAVDVAVNLTVGRWVADEALKGCDGVLHNIYLQVYAAEEAELGKALERLRGRASLDDMGVLFARRQSEERLFDPYVDAVHCIEQLGAAGHTLSSKLALLTQWSRDIDLSTRLALAGDYHSHNNRQSQAAQRPQSGDGGDRSGSSSLRFQGGSADDLLPIHQYVLSQCRLRGLHAHARMLADFAEEPVFVDPTSQEGFCVTNLVVCAMTLPRLHHGLRDTDGVLVPSSLFADRLRSVFCRLPAAAAAAARQQRALRRALGAADLCNAALGYVAAWLPAALTLLSRAVQPFARVVPLASYRCGAAGVVGGLLPADLSEAASLRDLGGVDEEAASALRCFCWQAAGSILEAVGLQLLLLSRSDNEAEKDSTGDPQSRGEQLLSLDRGTVTFPAASPSSGERLAFRVSEAILPSYLLFASDELSTLL